MPVMQNRMTEVRDYYHDLVIELITYTSLEIDWELGDRYGTESVSDLTFGQEVY